MNNAAVVSRDEWLELRNKLLTEEKEFTRRRDELSEARRQLPWVKVEQHYLFHNAGGELNLSAIFGDKSQLIVQHFMLGHDWQEGCPSCSFWADGFEGTTMHLAARDTAFVAISNAPYAVIANYKKRMGWTFDWLSSHGSSFNYDYHVSFSQSQIDSGSVEYNYRNSPISMNELPGISVFAKDESGQVFHTYSCYARGLDNMNVVYQYLDLLPKGRDEVDLKFPMAWVQRHDTYDNN